MCWRGVDEMQELSDSVISERTRTVASTKLSVMFCFYCILPVNTCSIGSLLCVFTVLYFDFRLISCAEEWRRFSANR